MAVQKNAVEGFTSSWDKTAAWAQSQGISKKDYYPIYQMDSKRLLAGETPMSTSERTRAILAANNPNNVTPVQSDNPNPANVWGNTINDLKNIFTGLSPNHLVANIYDTVKNTVTHPSSVIKPIEDVVGGVATGNMGQVKQGLELAAGLKGPGSILSWLPGVYDVGEFAQGGVGEVLAHPVQSFLDVAPFAPVGRVIAAAADASRVATMAERVGMTPEAFSRASIFKMGKSMFLSKKIADTPLASRANTLVNADGSPVTIGTALDRWITTNTGMGKTLSSLMKGMLNINDTRTDYELALYRPAEMAMNALDNEQQRSEVTALLNKSDPRAQGKTESQIANDDSIDPKVRTAYQMQERVRSFVADQGIGTGAVVAKARPDGTMGFYQTAGEASPVVKAADDLQKAQDDLVKAMNPANDLVLEMKRLDEMGDSAKRVFGGQTWPKAYEAAQRLHGKQRYEATPIDFTKKGKPKSMVTLDLKKQAEFLFGKREDPMEGSGEGGLAGSIDEAMGKKDFSAVKALTQVGLNRLRQSGPLSLDATLDPAFTAFKTNLESLHRYAEKRIELDKKFGEHFTPSRKGKGAAARQRAFSQTLKEAPRRVDMRSALAKYLKARRVYSKAVYDHPTADWIDVVKDTFIKNLLAEEDKYYRFEDLSSVLHNSGWADKEIAQLRRDPTKMAQLIVHETEAASGNFHGVQIMTRGEIEHLWRSGIEEADKLRKSGHEVSYIPSLSSLDVRDTDPGRYGIHVSPKGAAQRSSRAFKKQLAFTPQKHDVAAALHIAGKEALQIDGTIEYMEHVLTPHLVDQGTAWETIKREFKDQILGADMSEENIKNLTERIMRDNFRMAKFDPQSTFGFSLPRWGAQTQYIPVEIANALDKMLVKGQFPMDGVYSKLTNLFRFSILGLSPRYTAHVVFGGSFLLALRSSPHVFSAVPKAFQIMKNNGEVPRGTFDGAAQRGIDPVVYRSFAESPRNKGSRVFHTAGGSQAARWLAEENIEKVQGIKLAAAKPMHWLKAVGDLNYKVTNWASSFQRAVAYVDHLQKVDKRFRDPITGEMSEVSKDRAHAEAIEHSLKVLGDLKAMTPLERNTLTNLFPFYGWTRHILHYVLTMPVDHPFRTQFVSTLAEQNSADIASGLPKRLQFLLFLGSPDIEGNVNAVDVRAMDPLRDVANYATWSGWIASLNPVITAPLAMVDPQIIFGGNPLYPNVTYDQFYGIESAGSQGSPLTAIEQVVPQVTALQNALSTAGNLRQQAATNPNGFYKSIFNALNIPFAQVQHINLKQMAAKDEIDRYHVASTAATNAFKTGDFSSIAGLSSVPDPLNAQYEVSPDYLQNLYKQLLEQYPGQAPSETAIPPPAPPL